MAIAGVLILYHPSIDVIENVQSYLPHIDKLYVADNTEGKMSTIAVRLQGETKVELIYDGNNEGIAKRLNEAAKSAIKEGYNWLLTMDQDSRFEEGAMENYLLCAGSFLYKDSTAMFGVEYENKNINTEQSDCRSLKKNKVITSGSILNLKLFEEVGSFDEKLFIDDVDFDYCYRARMKGFEVIQFPNIFLVHQLGRSAYHRSLKNMQITHRSLHSPKRIFYMVRNYLYVKKKYKNRFPEDIELEKKAVINRIKNNLLYNNKRWKVLLAIVSATKDHLTNKR